MKWIFETVATKDPRQLKFPYALWTRKIIGAVIAQKFGVTLSLKAIGNLLAQLGLSVQRPLHRAFEQDASLVQRWLKTEFPAIREAAKKAGASIFFGDEADVRSDYHSGTTWAPIGQTPVVRTTGKRFGCNMIPAVSAKGELRFMITRGGVNADVFHHLLAATDCRRQGLGGQSKPHTFGHLKTAHRSMGTSKPHA